MSRHMRPPRHIVLHAPVVLLAVLFALAGCERDGRGGTGEERQTSMTEEQFVTHVAALTVATEEGLTGHDALARALELGGGDFTRKDVERYADLLRADPEHWAAVAKRIDKRVDELRSRERTDR